MELGISNKVAFVAASSKGLGKAVAYELAVEGAQVIICARGKEELIQTKKEIEAACQKQVYAITGDLAIAKDRQKMIKEALAHFGIIDILVTNSGGPDAGKFEDLEQSQWDKAYNLLLAATNDLIRGFLPGMKKNNWGRIIAITSVAVKQPVNNLIISNAVRASVAGLMKTLAGELGQYNITVNNVMPGYTSTERLRDLMANSPNMKDIVKEIPLMRFAEPREFAAAVAFLASQRASYITGTSLAVDGGWIKNII